MAQPTPYNRLYDFSDYQEVNPTKPLRGSEVDAEFDAIKLTTDQIRANAALIQRDDGSLANQSVTPDSLSAGTLAMIHQGEYLPRGAWAATTVYAMGDLVTYNAATYLCIAAHTAQAAFPNDLSANRWVLIANGALSGQASAIDLFEGNAATTVYTLSYTYANSNAAVVFVGGVALIPVQDFTISGTTLTFVVAPPAPSVAGRKNVMVRGTGIEAQLAANAAAAAAVNAQGYSTAASGSAAAALASQNAAAASQSAAATSATNASSSATSASNSAATATTQAASASASATSADASEAGAGSSATAAAASATSASASATTATTQATNAANSATAASNSATSAANSATTATTQAATATTQASNAATSASNASTSATAAGNSATNAATSATSANNSATSATNSANSAASSASSANTSATNAAASQTAAAGSASAASTSATNAAMSATAAASSATSAGNSATAAASSQSAAAASAAAAAASYDNFDDRYLGPKSAAPATDNDGLPLLIGALYFNTVTNSMQVYGSSGWTAAGSSVNGTTARFRYIATAGQTTFTGTSTNGLVLAYDAGFVDVYLNGVRLDSTDFTASSGTSIVLASAAAAGDELNIVAFGTFSIANTYTQAQVDAALAGRVSKAGDTMNGNLTVPEWIQLYTDGVNGTQRHGRISGTASSNNPYAGGVKLEFYNYNGAAYQFFDGLAVDGAGRVTMPNQTAFVAGGNANVTLSAGNVIPFNLTGGNVGLNRGNCFNTSTYRFTAPVSGLYFFSFSIYNFASQSGSFCLAKNGAYVSVGSDVVLAFEGGTAEVSIGYSSYVPLNAGDYVEVIVRPAVGGTYQAYLPHSIFSGHLIG